MKESELAFWQKTARHYTRSMDRSAPLYAAVCERIRPHLSRDMNVLELACGTGQLSFPLSALCPALGGHGRRSAMIQEAKKRIGSSRLHFSVQDAALCPTRRSPSTRWSSPMPCTSCRSRIACSGRSSGF